MYPLPLLTDEQLVLLGQSGHRAAFGELYRRYHPLVMRKCLGFTHDVDQAQDLTQDVMVRAMDRLGSFKGASTFSTWLFSLTVNHCLDVLRKQKNRHYEALADAMLVLELDEEDEALLQDQWDLRAMAALDALLVEDRELLLAKYQHHKSVAELMVQYQLSASALKMRLLRARKRALTLLSQAPKAA